MVDSRATFFGVHNAFSVRKFDQDFDLQKKCHALGDICEVRAAIDRATGEMRTVKVYRKIDLTEATAAVMKREMDLLSGIDHVSITKVHAAYEDELRYYLVIDTIRGCSLYEKIIKQGQLSEAEAGIVCMKLLSAVRCLHSNGLVLRNLRPETVFFES